MDVERTGTPWNRFIEKLFLQNTTYSLFPNLNYIKKGATEGIQ